MGPGRNTQKQGPCNEAVVALSDNVAWKSGSLSSVRADFLRKCAYNSAKEIGTFGTMASRMNCDRSKEPESTKTVAGVGGSLNCSSPFPPRYMTRLAVKTALRNKEQALSQKVDTFRDCRISKTKRVRKREAQNEAETVTGKTEHVEQSASASQVLGDGLLTGRELRVVLERLDISRFPSASAEQVVSTKQSPTNARKGRLRKVSATPMHHTRPTEAKAKEAKNLSVGTASLKGKSSLLRKKTQTDEVNDQVQMTKTPSEDHKGMLERGHPSTARQDLKMRTPEVRVKAGSAIQITAGKGTLKRKVQTRMAALAIAAAEVVPDDMYGDRMVATDSAIQKDIFLRPSTPETFSVVMSMRTPELNSMHALSECSLNSSESKAASSPSLQSLKDAEKFMHVLERQRETRPLHPTSTPDTLITRLRVKKALRDLNILERKLKDQEDKENFQENSATIDLSSSDDPCNVFEQCA